MSGMNIRVGHIARHTPRGAGAQGREAAVVDVAQDLLLAHMHEHGLLGGLAMKGGTAIRKLYAGNDGRFSLDLDFACFGPDADVAPKVAGHDEAILATSPFAHATASSAVGSNVPSVSCAAYSPSHPSPLTTVAGHGCALL